MNQQELERLIERAAILPEAIRERAATLSDLRARLAVLEKTSCTGRIRWRRDGKTPKMFVAHGVDGVCPVHGRAKLGKRLRSYVGADPERQAEAQAAIEREEKRREVQAQVDALKWVWQHLDRSLYDSFRRLGYTYPTDDGVPRPDPEWMPGARRR